MAVVLTVWQTPGTGDLIWCGKPGWVFIESMRKNQEKAMATHFDPNGNTST
jgi:hypothetical protein